MPFVWFTGMLKHAIDTSNSFSVGHNDFMAQHRIIIDTDPGIDDAMAIFFAINSSEIELIGLTTTFGNGHTDLTTINALRLLEIAGRSDIPVAQGAAQPIASRFDEPGAVVHGDDGQGNLH